MDLVVLVGGDEEVRVAVLAGEVRRAGIRRDQDGAAFGHRLHDRDQNVREDRADDEIDLVAVDQRLGLADGDVGLEFVILHDQFDFAAAELAAQLFLTASSKPLLKLLAEHSRRTRQRGDDSDFQLFLRAAPRSPKVRRSRRRRQGSRTYVHRATPQHEHAPFLEKLCTLSWRPGWLERDGCSFSNKIHFRGKHIKPALCAQGEIAGT